MRCAPLAGEVAPAECCGCVCHDERGEAQITRRSRRRLHGIVRDYTCNHHALDSTSTELGFEAGADKGAVCVFFYDSLARTRHDLVLELRASLTCPVRGIRLEGNVADMKDRPGSSAPEGQQLCNVGFGVWIVAIVSPARIIDRLLHVDDQQHRI